MNRKTVVSSVLVVLFWVSLFPMTDFFGVVHSHGSSDRSIALAGEEINRFSQGAYAYTDKLQYAAGQPVTLTFQNIGSTTITLGSTAPWLILNASGSIVFSPIALMMLVYVSPGQTLSWGWNQVGSSGKQVPPGIYTFRIATSAGTFTATFRVFVNVYKYYSQRPAPMGIADYGIGPNGPYQYATNDSVGIVTVASLRTDNSTVVLNYPMASFQLNVHLVFNTSYGQHVYWIQNVAVINTSSNYINFINNVWNNSARTASQLTASSVSGNGTVVNGNFYYYWANVPNVYPGDCVQLNYPATIMLKVTSGMSSSGNPTVSFVYDDGYGSITYDTVTFTNVGTLTSLTGFEVNGFDYTPYRDFYNSELMLGGFDVGPPICPPSGIFDTNNIRSDVRLRLEYWNGHNYQIVPNAYNFGETYEKIDNTLVQFSYDQKDGTINAWIRAGAGQQLGKLYDQSQIGMIVITSPLSSGTLKVTNASVPNAPAWQIPFVNGEVTVTLYPGYYDLQLSDQKGQLFDEWKYTVSAGQTLSLQTPSWPMFHHDLTHTGYSTSTAPRTNRTLWSYTTGGVVDWSSPAVVNGVVYVGSNDTNLYALNASTGTLIWKCATGSGGSSSPAVANGVVYVGSDDWNVYALNVSTGTLIWKYMTGSLLPSSPAVANGVVYVGSEDGNVYALNSATGKLVWSFMTGGGVTSSPSVVNGVVYVGSNDNKTYALNATTGAQVWSYTTAGSSSNNPFGWAGVWSSPAVAGGVVYVGANDGNVYALNASTGALLWKYTTGNGVFSSPAVVNGVVYVGSWDGNIYALNATTGAQVWTYAPGYWWVWSSPAVAGGVVYVGSQDNKTYALNAATGALIWSYRTGGVVDSSPAVVNGVVYVGSWDGKVYAFGGTLPSDLNGDGIVDIQDITIVAIAFGSKTGDPSWNQAADLNKDGVVDIVDITMIAVDFGKTV